MNKESSLDDIEKRLLLVLKETLTTLYPSGQIKGSEFLLADLSGEKGTSLSINLRTGLWSDFAIGASGKILKFFSYRNNGNFPKGMEEIRQLLKLPPLLASNNFKRPKKEWLDDIGLSNKPIQYLTKERGIPRSVLVESKIKATATEYVFTGYDEDNKLCYAQYIKRTPDGKKDVRFTPDGKNTKKLCLWGMHTMRDLVSADSVIITEGVIDALTFRAADIFAVSIPSGVNNTDWIEHSWNWLNQFTTIYLCFDWDEAGQKSIQAIAGRLGVHRCKRLIIPEKDANQCMMSHPDNWIQLLKGYINEAPDITPPKRVTAGDIRSLINQAVTDGPLDQIGDLLLGWEFRPTEANNKPLNFRLRGGEQTIWTGYPGGGKTTLLFQHLAYTMFVLGEKVAIASLEEPAAKVALIILTQALGYHPKVGDPAYEQALDYISEKLIIFNELGDASMDEVLEFFEYSTRKDGVKHCVLDSLMCTDLDVDGDKENVNKMIKRIIRSINTSGSHYHIVAHCVKGDDESWDDFPTMNSVKGVNTIIAKAHNIIVVWRNKVKENGIEAARSKGSLADVQRRQIEYADTIIKITKNRNGKQCGQIKAWFDPDSYRFRPDSDERLDQTYFSLEGDAAI